MPEIADASLELPAGVAEVVVAPAARGEHLDGRGQLPVLALELLQRRHAAVLDVDVERVDPARLARWALPMFASGQRLHHAATVSGSVVASWKPCSVRGCFAGFEQSAVPHEQPAGPFGEWTGKTGIPRTA